MQLELQTKQSVRACLCCELLVNSHVLADTVQSQLRQGGVLTYVKICIALCVVEIIHGEVALGKTDDRPCVSAHVYKQPRCQHDARTVEGRFAEVSFDRMRCGDVSAAFDANMHTIRLDS